MKKLFCLINILGFLFLCGCNNNIADATAITEGISFTAEIEIADENYIFDVRIPQKSKMILKATAPKIINETVFEISGTQMKISCGELSYTASLSDLPENSPIRFISYVFSDASLKKNEVNFKENTYFICGKNEIYDYKLYLGTTGLPIKITDSKTNLTAIIKQATINVKH